MLLMEKKNYNYKSFIKQGYKILNRALEDGWSIRQFSQALRKLVNSYSGLIKPERYVLYRALYGLYRAALGRDNWEQYIALRASYDKVVSAARQVLKQKNLRDRRAISRAMLKGPDTVFFMCSVHNKPRDLHKEFQGKIFVDRFWRTKVSGSDYYAVLSYIRNHQLMTVQEAMQEPIWLTTAMNCRHYWIPLDTYTVLHTSAKVIASRHRNKLYTPDEYYNARASVFEALNRTHPCNEYLNKTKRRGYLK